MNSLSDKVAIVTGGSSGFGRAIALELAVEGAALVIADVHEQPDIRGFEDDASETTVEAIRKIGGRAIFVQCDVIKIEEVIRLVDKAVLEFSQLDILVNNAGVFTGMAKIHEMEEREFDYTMNVNVKGVWNCCQRAIIQFLKQGRGGKIINIVSQAGLIGLAREPAYCASKGACVTLTKQLAIDYGPEGITVNGICPNFAPTAMCRDVYEDTSRRRAIEELTPLRRWVMPKEVARLACYLASSDADYITGDLVKIDGGYTAGR